jgi:hypothetical protein
VLGADVRDGRELRNFHGKENQGNASVLVLLRNFTNGGVREQAAQARGVRLGRTPARQRHRSRFIGMKDGILIPGLMGSDPSSLHSKATRANPPRARRRRSQRIAAGKR